MNEPLTAGRWQVPAWYRRLGSTSWYFIGIVLALSTLAAAASATASIVAPVLLGAVLAIVFEPVVDRLELRRVPRPLAALTVVVVLIGVIVGVAWWMLAILWDQSAEIGSVLDDAVAELRRLADDLAVDPALVTGIRDAIAGAGSAFGRGIAALVVAVVDSALGLAMGSVLGAIVMYYLLKDGGTLAHAWVASSAHVDGSRGRIVERIARDVRNYFRGRTLLALSNAVGIGLGVAVLGVPAAIAIAVVNFFGAYVPYLGALIGGTFAVLMTLGGGGVGRALAALVIVVVVNIGLENLLEPRLLGDSLDLHPLLVLLATSLGGLVAGMIGLVLAAPATAIALDIKRELAATGFFADDPDPDLGT